MCHPYIESATALSDRIEPRCTTKKKRMCEYLYEISLLIAKFMMKLVSITKNTTEKIKNL